MEALLGVRWATGYKQDGHYDMCLPTHSGKGHMWLSGNDGNWFQVGNAWWSWTHWMRVTVHARPGTQPSSDPAHAWFQAISADRVPTRVDLSSAPMYQGGTSQFDQLNVPGWVKTVGPQVRPHYDDVYFAVGSAAAARVEIGDSQDYTACRNLELAEPVTWTDQKLQVVLHGNNEFTSLEGAWIHIHDANDRPVGAPRQIVRN